MKPNKFVFEASTCTATAVNSAFGSDLSILYTLVRSNPLFEHHGIVIYRGSSLGPSAEGFSGQPNVEIAAVVYI